MASKPVRDAARALRTHSRNHVKYHAPPPPRYAIVRTMKRVYQPTPTSPILKMSAEVTDTHEVLTEDDLVLCQNVRLYHAEHAIEIGDTLFVHRMGNGDWTVTAVVSPNEVGGGNERTL